MRIRAFTPADTTAVVRVFRSAVAELGSCYYAESAVRAWLRAVDDITAFEGRLNTGLTLVADADDGCVAAFGQLQPCDCVNLLYCAPAFARHGYATAVYRRLESAATTQAITTLQTDASRCARPFFERQGFTVVAIEHVMRHGAEFECFRMCKHLLASAP